MNVWQVDYRDGNMPATVTIKAETMAEALEIFKQKESAYNLEPFSIKKIAHIDLW